MSFSEFEWRGVRNGSLAALIGNTGATLDAEGVREAFGEIAPTGRTCILGARRISPPRSARSAPLPFGPLLEKSCRPMRGKKVALALSGGIDSAVLAALLRDEVVAYTLTTHFPNYCEEGEAVRMARHLGIEIRRVNATEEDFIRALPDAIRICESPLYNLHPVGRYLLARAARADGFDTLVTGDGADELFSDRSGADYLPIVDALARGAQITPFSPFCDPAFAAFVRIDPTKKDLRDFAASLAIPEDISHAPKRARFAPRMNLEAYWSSPLIETLAKRLGRLPSRGPDREYVGWPTLALFARSFSGLEHQCAA